MKYRVKTGSLKGYGFEDIIETSNNGETWHLHGNAATKPINSNTIACNPSWFEPVEEVQEGQYWTNEIHVLRTSDVGDGRVRLQRISRGEPYPNRDSIEFLHSDCRKLSADEIGEVLIEEARRRGYKKENFYCLIDDCVWGGIWDYKYYRSDDKLLLGAGAVYRKGKWAEIVGQNPNIEINGKKIEFHEDYVQFGRAKIDKRFFLQWNRELNDGINKCGCGNRRVTGMRVGEGLFNLEQIKEIAEYYE